ncbi:histidine phosphatase family protein [Pedococcus sp. KACC 23699]|uniref:Histidine phosphatase family protein n=1 Tax=Pedococcus sp. KACC 23699 TaxID=3149228 RepID=A0AAU7JQP3_9MICO
MSDLHCPATLLVARHGDAEYGHPSVLSDEGGWLSAEGRAQVRGMADSLRERNIARVYTSRLERAIESGQLVAEVLGVDVVAVGGLAEFSVGALAGRRHDDPELASVFKAWMHGDQGRFIPGGESGATVLRRYREALQGIADQHRGETVVVVSHGGVMSFVLPRLEEPAVRADLVARAFLPNCAVAEVEADGDGFRVLTWPGSRERGVV